MKIAIRFTYHFQCDHCNQSWALDNFKWHLGKEVTCPWCAHTEAVSKDPLFHAAYELDTLVETSTESQKVEGIPF